MLGMIPFIKAAGRGVGKLFGGDDAKEKLEKEVDDLGLKRDGVDIHVDDDGKVRVAGRGLTQEQKEKLILAVGNVEGVGGVEDEIESDDDVPASQFYTVRSGDSLSKIAKEFYGNAMRYPEIFEANRPMLSDPNKIYPGQVLRIPADSKAKSA